MISRSSPALQQSKALADFYGHTRYRRVSSWALAIAALAGLSNRRHLVVFSVKFGAFCLVQFRNKISYKCATANEESGS